MQTRRARVHPSPVPVSIVRSISVFAALAAPLQLAAQQERVATHLITHNQISIARPASALWPYIVDPSAWKQGNRLAHISGPVGETGELFAAVSMTGAKDPDYYVQNVELTANHRRTIKIVGRDHALIGFAAFTLTESNDTTVVSYDVFSETLIPLARARQTTGEALAESERMARESSSRRFDSELAMLKKLAEGR